jgi:hypothetical protein
VNVSTESKTAAPHMRQAMNKLHSALTVLSLSKQELVDAVAHLLVPFIEGTQKKPGPIYLWLKSRIFEGEGAQLAPGLMQGAKLEDIRNYTDRQFRDALFSEAIFDVPLIWRAVTNGILMEMIPDHIGPEAAQNYAANALDNDAGSGEGRIGQPAHMRNLPKKADDAGESEGLRYGL